MGWRSFLCLFAQQHAEFRLPELLSIAAVTQCELKYDPHTYSNKNPFLMLQLQSEDSAKRLTNRALLIRSMIELWGWGRDYRELETSIKQLSPELMEPYTKPGYTFKIITKGFAKKCSEARQKQLYEKLSFLPFQGKVDLTNPQHEFYILEDYGDNPNSAPPEPHRVFFGRLVARGQRHLIQQFAIRDRHFIGNTSMDAELSLIMANQAQVKPGSLVYDPFAGTGSLLIASAHFGGYVVGADIDYVLVHGRGRSSRAGAAQKWRGKDENVRANLRQYGLEDHYIDMLVADADKCIWRNQEIFDAIVTDPPYGIREGARKIAPLKSDQEAAAPIPAVSSYKLSEMFADLLEFAARFLVMGGRLVYWIPFVKHEFTDSHISSHPCLRLVSQSEQPLQRDVARKLVTMEKHAPWSDEFHGRATQTISSSVHDTFRNKYFQYCT